MTDTPRALVATLASDVKPQARRRDWGPWELAADYETLEHNERVYEVNLQECRTAAQVLDCLAQIATKTWADPVTVTGLLNAIDDVLNLQGTVCSSGRAKTLTRAEVTKRVESAVTWAPRYAGFDHLEDW